MPCTLNAQTCMKYNENTFLLLKGNYGSIHKKVSRKVVEKRWRSSNLEINYG